jgi:hypothetical protein
MTEGETEYILSSPIMLRCLAQYWRIQEKAWREMDERGKASACASNAERYERRAAKRSKITEVISKVDAKQLIEDYKKKYGRYKVACVVGGVTSGHISKVRKGITSLSIAVAIKLQKYLAEN